MTITTGPYAGRTRDVSVVDPHKLLGDCYRRGWEWTVDYSRATEEEAWRWGREDISLRAVRALVHGRQVRFLGKIYQGTDAAGPLEDAIVASGRMIALGRDDETGVDILAHGWAQ